jgi:23S rRNA pseudouridine955/2504/2580 synthase/23S rRNA pseudouridine1911/1915/1917 synthase
MKEIGHPIACDPLYGDGKPILVSGIRHNYKLSKKEEEEKPILGRLALHASLLSFEFAGKEIALSAELPKDLRATLQQLEKTRKGKISG